jgi:HEAT repeat protein
MTVQQGSQFMDMRRVIVVAIVVFMLGCGSNPPTKSEPAPTELPVEKTLEQRRSVDKRPSETSPAPPAADIRPTKAKSSRSDVPPSGIDNELRKQLGTLIEPGAAGRWQVDEATAAELEKSPITTETLLTAARDNEAKVRRGAWFLLADKFDSREAAYQAQLRIALTDDDAIVRALALRIVSELPEPELPMLVEPLAQLLSSEELTTENRTAIARLLGRLKEQAAKAEEPLAQAARNDEQARVRAACLVALWQIAAPTANLPRFRTALQDADASVRLVAAARLREMGPDAAVAAEGLARSLEDQDERVREAAAEALIRIGEPAVKPLTGELSVKSPAARRWAVFALARLGTLAKPAQAELERVSSNEHEVEETRKMAALAVKRFGS